MTCLQHESRISRQFGVLSMPRPVDQAAMLRLATDRSVPRLELVARIRAQLAAGTYDINGKFDRVLDRLLDLM